MSKKTLQLTTLMTAHICMFLAEVTWGIMAPLGKDAMTHGLTGIDMVVFRTVGGALCFWITSLVAGIHERVSRRDLALFFLAGMLGIVTNQCCYTIGLSLTSPINASIVTTSMPIFTLLIGLTFMGERLTWRKLTGIGCGVTGALSLILSSAGSAGLRGGNISGDLLCMTAQLSFACYLALFGRLIGRYHTVTCMKWMFLFASMVTVPLGAPSLMEVEWAEITPRHWAETAFIVFGATFLAYILMMRGQKNLTPTQVSVYNYVQPVVSTVISLILGIATMGWMQGAAVALVFIGVRLVAQNKKTTTKNQ